MPACAISNVSVPKAEVTPLSSGQVPPDTSQTDESRVPESLLELGDTPGDTQTMNVPSPATNVIAGEPLTPDAPELVL